MPDTARSRTYPPMPCGSSGVPSTGRSERSACRPEARAPYIVGNPLAVDRRQCRAPPPAGPSLVVDCGYQPCSSRSLPRPSRSKSPQGRRRSPRPLAEPRAATGATFTAGNAPVPPADRPTARLSPDRILARSRGGSPALGPGPRVPLALTANGTDPQPMTVAKPPPCSPIEMWPIGQCGRLSVHRMVTVSSSD